MTTQFVTSTNMPSNGFTLTNPDMVGGGLKLSAASDTGFSGVAITLSTVDSTPIGATTPSTGAFTTVSATGNINSSAGVYEVAGTQVVEARQTGWTLPTGTASRATFATGSVTLPNLAEAVFALITDLETHGLIGT